MQLTEVIEKRRSIRKFSDKPVSREILTELIKEAALAPTASNLQAWRFFVADDPELVRDIDSFSPGLSGKPPVIIAIASDLAGSGAPGKQEQSCLRPDDGRGHGGGESDAEGHGSGAGHLRHQKL